MGAVVVDKMSNEQFARTFSQRAGQLAWFLGAGTSAAARIPTGLDMITDFKARLFCAQTGLPRREVDATDPLWEERIATYFDGAHGLPPAGDPAEYAVAFETVFPEARDRRSYIEEAIKKGTPSYGHRVLAALITSGTIRCLFTTNFDPLVERTTILTDELVVPERRAHLTVGALDLVDRAVRCVRDETWPLLVKLHGDYQSEQLKNTPLELQAQEKQLRSVLVSVARRFGLVVVGYSGRDASIMDALDEAVASADAMPAGLWWVSRPGSRLLPRVVELLDRAEAAGVEGHVVESETFDELCGDIEREIALDHVLHRYVNELRPQPLVEDVALPTQPAERFPALRCSALELVGLPAEATELSLDKPLTAVEARRLVKEAGVWATVTSRGTTAIGFGANDDLERALSPVNGRASGTARLMPSRDSVDLGLVYDAFVRAITRRRPLRPVFRSRGHHVIVRPPNAERNDGAARQDRERLAKLQHAYGTSLTGTVPKLERAFAEAIEVRLECWQGRWWCVFEPFTWVDLPRSAVADGHEPEPDFATFSPTLATGAKELAADWRRERWAQRYNSRWNDIIAAWAKLLAPEGETDLAAHHFSGPGINATFRMSWITAWSSPGRRYEVHAR